MKKRDHFALVLLVALFAAGCQRDNMKEFEYGKPHVMTDEGTGKKYIVEHFGGNSYRVMPIE